MTDQVVHGVHEYDDDPRNEGVLIHVNGELKHRAEAVVSVFDCGVRARRWRVGGAAGARRPSGVPRRASRPLYEGAKAIALDIGLGRHDLRSAIYRTLRANEMTDGVHVRLMVTRGVKRTPYQDPRMTAGPATIVIIPEYKQPRRAVLDTGIRLFTVHVRRPYPDVLDPKLNTHSKLNDITACIQAYSAGADEALMLDPHGFVATCNSTHFFVVRRGELWTSSGAFCLGGITRATVLRLARDADIPTYERDFSLTDVYGADEAFVTGTFAGIVPVREVDGRMIGDGAQPAGHAPPADALPGRHRALTSPRRHAADGGDHRARGPAGRVVGPSQHLDRPDAVVGEPPRHDGDRRAAVSPTTSKVTGLDHPGREEVIAAGEPDWRNVVAALLGPVPDGISGLLPEAHGPSPGARHRANMDRRPHERDADPRPTRGGGLLRALPGRRPPPTISAFPSRSSCTTSWWRRERRRP